jgi:uncharacterized repeat protein (TIGR01451 family)
MALQKLGITAIIGVVAIGLILTVAAAGVLSSSQTVRTAGTLTSVQTSVNVGVYSNSACSQNASFVDWGSLRPGQTITKTVWVKNAGNANATLSLATNTWSPTNAGQSISLTWNQAGTVLAANQVVQATLTLTVSSSISSSITSFGFNIQITGTG